MGTAGTIERFKNMDLNTFNKKVMKRLKRWSHLGEKTDEYQSQFIGHYDKNTPLAYLHILYQSGDIEEVVAAEQALGISFPKQYRDFLELFNGACFFNPAGFDVFGVAKKEYLPEYNSKPWRFPSNIVEKNNQSWLKKLLPNNALVIGRDDALNVYIVCCLDDGSIISYDPLAPDDFSQQWPSFNEWLISEVENLFVEHDDNGDLLTIKGTFH
ncbi:MAG: SMI1/KNR4 family protein [Litorimonas sp.]